MEQYKMKFERDTINESIETRIEEYCYNLHMRPYSEMISCDSLTKSIESDIIRKCFSRMVPEFCDIYLIGVNLSKSPDVLKEEIFEITYTVKNFSKELKKLWKSINITTEPFSHPPPYEYMLKTISILPPSDSNPIPSLLIRNDKVECYYRPECNFSSPYINLSLIHI